MAGPGATLERYARGLESGLLTVPEVASAVLNVLADAPDRAGLWARAPVALRRPVLAYLAEVGAANVPPAFWFGPGEPDPARRAAHTTRRRAVAAELLATAEPGAAADRAGTRRFPGVRVPLAGPAAELGVRRRGESGMEYRQATVADALALAAMNGQLIRDEGHRNPMTVAELAARLAGWLRAEYEAVLFEEAREPAGYALYRRDPEHVYLRQFFVRPDRRRRGVGREALRWLWRHAWGGGRVRVEVLAGNAAGVAFWRAVGFRDYGLTLEAEGGPGGSAGSPGGTEVCVRPVDPTAPEAAALLAALDAYQSALYPPASAHLLPAAALAAPDAVFLGAFAGGRLVGCGGYVRQAGGCGELKRMFVRPEARGLGVGRRLLAALEGHAAAAGLTVLLLETGVSQPEALRLYAGAGYERRGPFGAYTADPLSVFLEKRLGAAPVAAPARNEPNR